MAHIPHNLYENLIKSVDGNTSLKVQVPIGVSAIGLEVDNLGSSRSAVNISGGDLDISDGTASISSDGVLKIFGLGTPNDTDTESMLFQWNGTSSKFEIKASSSGTGSVRPIVIGDVLEVNSGNILLTSIPTADPSVSGAIWSDNGVVVLSGSTASSGNPSSGIAGAIQFSNGSGGFSSDATNLFWNDTSNRLGIGTNSLSSTLNIGGDRTIYFIGGNGGINASTNILTVVAGVINLSTNNVRINNFDNGAMFNVQSDVSTRKTISIRAAASQTANLTEWQNSSGTVLTCVDEIGRIGVGTSSPSHPIHVSSTSNSTMFIQQVGTNDASIIFGNNSQNWSVGIDASSSNALKFSASNDVGVGAKMTILTSGRVGINTVSPDALLHIADSNEQLRIGYDQLEYTSFAVNSSGNLYINTTGGSVAVGELNAGGTNNFGKLEVIENNLAAEFNALSLYNSATQTIGNAVSLLFVTSGNVGTGSGGVAKIQGVVANATVGSRQTDLAFFTDLQLSGQTEHMRITGTGRVGIGTTLPDAKFQVNTVSAATKGFIVKATASQTASLTEWQDSSGNPVASIGPTGNLTAGIAIFTSTTDAVGITIQGPSNTTTLLPRGDLKHTYSTENRYCLTSNAGVGAGVFGNDAGAIALGGGDVVGNINHGVVAGGAAGNRGELWFYGGADLTSPAVVIKSDGEVGIGTNDPGAKLEIETGAAATKGLIIQAAVTQTANLTEWQNSSGTVLAYVAADGSSSFSGTTTVSDLNIESLGTADSVTTTYNSENLTWNGSYWDGAAAQNTNAVVKLVAGVTENYFSITPDDRNAGEYKFYPDELIVPGTIAITSATISPSAGDWITLSSANHPDINEDYYIRPAIVGSLSRDYLAIGCDSATYHSITFAPDGRIGFGSAEPLSSKALVEIEHATITPQMTIRNGNDAMHFTVTDHHPRIILDTDGTNRHATYGIAVLGTSYWTAGMHGNTDYQLRNNAGTTVLTIAQTTGAATFVNSVSAIAASLISNAAANIPLTVQGAASQTANLTEWKNSSGTVMAYVAADGSTSWKSSSSGTAHSFESSGSSTIARFSRGGTPQIILDVDSNDYVYGKFITNNAARNTGITFGNSIDAKYWTIQNDSRDTSNSLIIGTSSTLTDSTNFNAAVMTLQQDGKVGIGTNSPATKLDVAGDINLSGGDSSIYFDGAHARIHENAGDLDLHSFTDNAEIRLYGNTLVKAGSAAIPGLAFIPNPTTGIFQPVFNTLAIAVAGVESVRIINGGNVGIGETVPGAKLQVNTVSAATKGMIIKAAASQTANLTEWQNSSGTVVAYVAADGSSSFGGTTTVTDLNISALGTADSTTTTYNSENLTWNGSYWDGAAAQDTNAVVKLVTGVTENYFSVTPDDRNTGEYKFYFDEFVTPGDITVFGATFQPRSSSSNTLKIDYTPSTNNPRIDMPQNGDWSLARGGSDRVRFFSDWSQFYGENLFAASSVSDVPVIVRAAASHTANLTEWQDSSGTVLASVNKDGNILLSAVTPTLYLGNDSDQYIRGNTTSNYITFSTGNTEKVRIDSSGRVGIGITAPDKALHISHATVPTLKLTIPSLGETASDGLELLMDVGANAYLWNREAGTLQFGTNNLERVRIDSSGNVGIGETVPGAKLQVNTVSAATKGMIIKAAASQAVNLTEWQNSSGTAMLRVNNTGRLDILSDGAIYFDGGHAYISEVSGVLNLYAANRVVLNSIMYLNNQYVYAADVATGARSYANKVNNLEIDWRFQNQDLGGTWYDTLTLYRGGKVGICQTSPGARLQVNTVDAATKGLIIQAAASQAANLTEWQDSTGTVLQAIDKDGYFKSTLTVKSSTQVASILLLGSDRSVTLNCQSSGVTGGSTSVLQTTGFRTNHDTGFVLSSQNNNGTVTYGALWWDAEGQFAQRNSTTSQRYNLYNTYTDSSNYERSSWYFDGSGAILSYNAAGTGISARSLRFSSNNVFLNVGASGGFLFGNNLGNWWNINSSGNFTPVTNNTYDIGSTSSKVKKIYTSEILIQSEAAATIPAVFQGAATQTANLTEWRNSSGTVLAYVAADGSSSFSGTTTVSDLNIESLGTADSTTTTYNSENLTWNGSYWDGAAAQNTNAVVKLVTGVTENYFSITPDDRTVGEYEFYPDELVVPGNVVADTAVIGAAEIDATGIYLNQSAAYLHGSLASNDIRSSAHLHAGYGVWVRSGAANGTGRLHGMDRDTGKLAIYDNGVPYLYLAGDVLEQRNGTTAQTHRWYGSYTDASNYHRASLTFDGSTRYILSTENAGTGIAQNIRIMSGKDLDLFSATGRSVSIKTQSGNSGDFRCDAFNQWTMTADTATRIPLTIQGVASQSGNLQEWENSSGTTLASVGASGTIGVYTGGALFDGFDASSNQKFRLSLSGNGVLLNATNAAGMFRFLINSAEKVRVDSDGNVGIGATAPGAKLEIETGVAATKGFIIQAAISQTANLTEWQDSSGTVLSYVDANGQIHANGVSLPLSTKTANYIVTLLDHVIIADATTAGFNITLPDPTTCSGQQFIIKKKDATTNAVTVLPNSTETIDGEAVCVIDEQWVSNTFISDGANWLLI